MSKVYVGQSALTILLETGIDLSTATTTEIRYKKPDGTEGSWPATVTGSSNTKLSYGVADTSQLDQEGEWKVWAYAVFSSGTAIGEAASMTVYHAGQ
jgi:hypothetical protein